MRDIYPKCKECTALLTIEELKHDYDALFGLCNKCREQVKITLVGKVLASVKKSNTKPTENCIKDFSEGKNK